MIIFVFQSRDSGFRMAPKLRKEKIKVTPEEVEQPVLLEVYVDPTELRADQAESRAAEEMELREEAEKKAEASVRQVEALQLRLRQLLEEKAKQGLVDRQKQREEEQREAAALRGWGGAANVGEGFEEQELEIEDADSFG